MLKDVIVSLSGAQFYEDDMEPVEVISVGEYFNKDGKIYILYEEVTEDTDKNDELVKSTIKLTDDQVEIIRKGVNNTHMVFNKGQSNLANYQTPFGSLMIGIHTTSLKINKEEDYIHVLIDYSLDVNYTHVSDCKIEIKVCPKGTEDY